ASKRGDADPQDGDRLIGERQALLGPIHSSSHVDQDQAHCRDQACDEASTWKVMAAQEDEYGYQQSQWQNRLRYRGQNHRVTVRAPDAAVTVAVWHEQPQTVEQFENGQA